MGGNIFHGGQIDIPESLADLETKVKPPEKHDAFKWIRSLTSCIFTVVYAAGVLSILSQYEALVRFADLVY